MRIQLNDAINSSSELNHNVRDLAQSIYGVDNQNNSEVIIHVLWTLHRRIIPANSFLQKKQETTAVRKFSRLKQASLNYVSQPQLLRPQQVASPKFWKFCAEYWQFSYHFCRGSHLKGVEVENQSPLAKKSSWRLHRSD